jgi:hypothetical protein
MEDAQATPNEAHREAGSRAEGRSLLAEEEDYDDDFLFHGTASFASGADEQAAAWRQTPTAVLWAGGIFLLLGVSTAAAALMDDRSSQAASKTRATVVWKDIHRVPAASPQQQEQPGHPKWTTTAWRETPDKARETAAPGVPTPTSSRRLRGGDQQRNRRKELRRRRKQARRSSSLVHTHIVPQGGALSIECLGGTTVKRVRFASFGTPVVHPNGSFGVDAKCHSTRSQTTIEGACVGQSHCCLPVGTENFRDDPCRGTVKTLAVTLEGCDEHTEPTRFKRHCSLLGQPLLCDEDIEFLAGLDLPAAPEPVPPHVAIMVDTSWRPHLQHYVVHNVHNHTGWPIQIFHGPSNGPRIKGLFADLDAAGAITFTDIGSDYMEDWQRLSSMMLIDNFWLSVVGRKALVFQPDSIMCQASEKRIGDYTQYDYVGAPMAGPWWMTSDHDSQWSVGCGGFSLRDRQKAIEMCRTPACVTPAAGKLEDQQLGTMWKYLAARCSRTGIHVAKPSRFEAVKFAVEYDMHMDVLPGDDPSMPDGCTAGYYTGPKYDPGAKRAGKPPKWHPHPKPSTKACEWPHFVPMGCHKCWHWNWRTWKHMTKYCPEASRMRQLRAMYKVGVEFTGWPTRPRPTPIRGPAFPDPRYLPVDMQQGACKGRCDTRAARQFKKTDGLGYHK